MIFSNFISGSDDTASAASDAGSFGSFFEGASSRLRRLVSSAKISGNKHQEQQQQQDTTQSHANKQADDWQLERKFTLDEVQMHSNVDDLWIIIFDKVYDITDFVFEHPGGDFILLEYAGCDATQAFLGSRHGSSAYKMLDKYWIGILVDEELCYSNNSSYCSVYSNLSWRKNLTANNNATTITLTSPSTQQQSTTTTPPANIKTQPSPDSLSISTISASPNSSSGYSTSENSPSQTAPIELTTAINTTTTTTAPATPRPFNFSSDSCSSSESDDDDNDINNSNNDDDTATCRTRSGAIKITNNRTNNHNFYYTKTLSSPSRPSRRYLRTPSTISTQGGWLNAAQNYYQPSETIANTFELKSKLSNMCESPFFIASLDADC